LKLPDPLDLLFEILAQTPFQPTELDISWEENYPSLSVARKQLEDHYWDSACKQPRYSSLFNGTLCQLRKFDFSQKPFQLTLGPIQFKTHFYSVSKKSAGQQPNLPLMGLGVSAAVVTSDGQIVFMKRSDQVAVYPQKFDVFGGHIHPDAHKIKLNDEKTVPSPFSAIRQELEEELSLGLEQVDQLVGMGLIVNRLSGQPELLFRCKTGMAAQKLIQQAQTAKDRNEYSHIIQIPDKRQKVKKMLRKYAFEFSPSGLACLWVYNEQK
jgi:hypothetical protein